jgi:GNAT superfamily N-acetyltransferase
LATETSRTVVAELDGRAVGTVSVDPPMMARLFVVPEAQRQRVGNTLHDWAVAELGDTAELLVLQDNVVAREFYERRGWRQYGSARPALSPPHPPLLTYRLAP